MRRHALLVSAFFVLPLILTGCVGPMDGLFPPDAAQDAAGVAGQGVNGAQAIPDQFIAVLKAGIDPQAAAADLARATNGRLLHVYTTALSGFAIKVPSTAVQGIERDPRVRFVEGDRTFTIVVHSLPTGIDRIETDRNANADIDDTDDVRLDFDVAVIDTGIDGDHPDLNVAGGRNFAGGPAGKWDDGNGHGTHVAGTIAAIDDGQGAVGVAPGARVHAVRVCNNGGICSTSDMIAGIDWVADRKAEANDGSSDGDAGIDFASANMSISTSDDSSPCDSQSGALHLAICALVEKGVVFSLAAGNNGTEKKAYPEALAVSALADFDGKAGAAGSPTCRDDEDDTLANFSNYGSEVDIAAPGVCIFSTYKDGGYATISGTSMAAPHVAGAVALYLHANGSLPASDGTGVDGIETAIIDAALSQSHECGYTNEHAGDGSTEPLLFVNATSFGGDGSCEVASNGGGGGDAPAVDSLSLSEDNSGGSPHAEFNASWSVSDIDGDLDTVELTLYELDSNGTRVATEDSASVDVSGSDASGTTGLKARFDENSGKTYEVEQIVTDTTGNTTSSTAQEVEDGS